MEVKQKFQEQTVLQTQVTTKQQQQFSEWDLKPVLNQCSRHGCCMCKFSLRCFNLSNLRFAILAPIIQKTIVQINQVNNTIIAKGIEPTRSVMY